MQHSKSNPNAATTQSSWEPWQKLRESIHNTPEDDIENVEAWFELLEIIEHAGWNERPDREMATQYVQEHTEQWRKIHLEPYDLEDFEQHELSLLLELKAVAPQTTHHSFMETNEAKRLLEFLRSCKLQMEEQCFFDLEASEEWYPHSWNDFFATKELHKLSFLRVESVHEPFAFQAALCNKNLSSLRGFQFDYDTQGNVICMDYTFTLASMKHQHQLEILAFPAFPLCPNSFKKFSKSVFPSLKRLRLPLLVNANLEELVESSFFQQLEELELDFFDTGDLQQPSQPLSEKEQVEQKLQLLCDASSGALKKLTISGILLTSDEKSSLRQSFSWKEGLHISFSNNFDIRRMVPSQSIKLTKK